MQSMDKIISAELGFSPIDTKDYVKDIDSVLKLIEKSQLDYTVGMMSTVVIGRAGDIFKLIERIYKELDEVCGFTFHVNISNRCLACSQE